MRARAPGVECSVEAFLTPRLVARGMGTLDAIANALSRGGKGAIQYRCRGCERTFAYSAEVDDPDCPYCASTLEPTADR